MSELKNKINLEIVFDGSVWEDSFDIPADIEDFVDSVLQHFDKVLRDILSMETFKMRWDRLDEIQQEAIDQQIENLNE